MFHKATLEMPQLRKLYFEFSEARSRIPLHPTKHFRCKKGRSCHVALGFWRSFGRAFIVFIFMVLW